MGRGYPAEHGRPIGHNGGVHSATDRTQIYARYDAVAGAFLNHTGQLFDTAFSYSSIEHSGLGRFGDPINPFGDLEATAQVCCMLKPGGVFFLGLPCTVGRLKCEIQFNALRTYGNARLQHLTANWRVVEAVQDSDQLHQHQTLFVLIKDSDQ